jgi:hypothetical protein
MPDDDPPHAPPPTAASGRPPRHLLALRAALLNLAALGLAGAAWARGLVAPLFAADPTYQCHLIALVFALGLGLCLWRTLEVGRELDEAAGGGRRLGPDSPAGAFLARAALADGQGRAALAAALRLRLAARTGAVRHLGNLLVLLGLVGTVTGFIVALSGVDPARAGDAAAIGPMVASLIAGMGVALNTTLLGSVLNVWLGLNARLLEAGCAALLARLVEAAEDRRHA